MTRKPFIKLQITKYGFADDRYSEFSELIFVCLKMREYFEREQAAELEREFFPQQNYILGCEDFSFAGKDSRKLLLTDFRLALLSKYYHELMNNESRMLFDSLFITHTLQPISENVERVISLLREIDDYFDLVIGSKQFVRGFTKIFNQKFKGISYAALREES